MPDSFRAPLYPALYEQFGHDLIERGFALIGDERGRWQGTIEVGWRDPATGTIQTSSHVIEIEIGAGFPFQKPVVRPLDSEPKISGGRHQAPDHTASGDRSAPLCLWPDEGVGWDPRNRVEDVLSRVKTWFCHYHADDWPSEDRPPDLHLYFPSEGRLMLVGDDWSPPTEAVWGRFLVRHRSQNSVRVIAEAPGTGLSAASTPTTDRIITVLDMDKVRPRRVGIWFRLQREPRPCTKLCALLVEIDDATGQPAGSALTALHGLLGDRVDAGEGEAVLALGYPDSLGEERWLFFSTNVAIGAGKRTKWRRPETFGKISVHAFETARVDKASLMRRTGHTAQRLNECKVLLFGAGAVGSVVGTLLAKAGVGHLRICDSDRLRPGNAVRHAAGLSAVGYSKPSATASVAQNHAPDCELAQEQSTWDPAQILGWVQQADVVIDATATPTYSLLVNEIALQAHRPAVYVTAHRRAAIGRIRIVRPGEDACLLCHEDVYTESDGYPLIPVGDEGAFLEEGCGVPAVEASAIDVESTANWAARISLWLLTDKLADDNLCMVVNDVLPDAADPLSRTGVHWSRWAPIAGCECCDQLLAEQ